MYQVMNLRRLATLRRGFATKTATKDSRDVFGTLSQSGKKALAIHSVEKYLPEDADGYDKEEFDLSPRKNAYFYKYEITKYARQGSVGLRKALELFQTMKSKDRLTPTVDQFSPLIYGCAKAGYTKRAFDLYNESLKYMKKPTNSVVTCLINACAESPFPEYGLKRLDWLRDHLKFNYNYTLNKIQYRSAIKAYGKLGQLEEASKLVQEMIDNGIYPDTDTFNMLLIGCASNKEAGSTLALRIYKRLKLYGLKPSVVTYRLMLRCIRDCGMGSPQLIKQTIGELPALTSFDQRLAYKKLDNRKSSKDTSKNFEWLPLITDLGDCISSAVVTTPTSEGVGSKVKLLKQKDSSIDNPNNSTFMTVSLLTSQPSLPVNVNVQLPNLLSEDHLDLICRIEAIQFDKLKNGIDRLMLFGGIHGFLDTMKQDGCPPDNKTFSLILCCTRHNEQHQLEYFRLAKDYSIKRDLLFYDLLIRHICENLNDRTRLKRALRIIEEMHRDDIRPNISTFESMASGCKSIEEARRLLEDVKRCGFIVSDVMIKRMFNCAIHISDFRYLNGLIHVSREHNYRPIRSLVDDLEERRLIAHDTILKYERGQLKDSDKPDWLCESQIKYFDIFNMKLGKWLKNVDINEAEHPWSQFNVENTSKRLGFIKFVEKFKALDKVKQEAMERGEDFGNLMDNAEKIS